MSIQDTSSINKAGSPGPALRLDFKQTTDISGVYLTTAPADVITDIPNFTTAGGLITLHHKGYASLSGIVICITQFVIDVGGTPVYAELSSNGGNPNEAQVPLSGTTVISGLPAGTHTIKVRALVGNSGHFYLRNSQGSLTPGMYYEYFNLQIIEG